MLVVQRQQLVLILVEPEEPAFLDRPFDRRALGRDLAPLPVFDQLVLAIIGLVADRVPAFVAIEIQVAIGLHRLPDGLAGAVVVVLRGLDEAIIADIKSVTHFLEILRHFIRQRARRGLQLARFLQHLQTMHVGTGLEAHVTAHQPLETRDDIGGDRLIGVADMRATIGIADRGGDIIRFAHGGDVCRF